MSAPNNSANGRPASPTTTSKPTNPISETSSTKPTVKMPGPQPRPIGPNPFVKTEPDWIDSPASPPRTNSFGRFASSTPKASPFSSMQTPAGKLPAVWPFPIPTTPQPIGRIFGSKPQADTGSQSKSFAGVFGKQTRQSIFERSATPKASADSQKSLEKQTQNFLDSLGNPGSTGPSSASLDNASKRIRDTITTTRDSSQAPQNGGDSATKRARLDGPSPFQALKTPSYPAGEYVMLNPWGDSAGSKMLAITTFPRRDTPETMVWIMLLSDTGSAGCPTMVPVSNLIKIKYKPGDKIPVKIGWVNHEMNAFVQSAKLQDGKVCYQIGLGGSSFWVLEEQLG